MTALPREMEGSSEVWPELEEEARRLARRQKLNEALLGRAMQTPQGKMVGRFYAPPHPLEYLSGAIQQYMAGREGRDIDKGYGDIAKRRAETERGEIERVRGIEKGASGTAPPQSPNDMAGLADPAMPQGSPMPTYAGAVAPDPRLAVQEAFMSRAPRVQKYGELMLKGQEARDLAEQRARAEAVMAAMLEQGRNVRHQMPGGNAVLGAQTATRGQDLTAATAATQGAANRATTERGQDLRAANPSAPMVVIQTDQGPMVVNKPGAAATPIVGPEGTPLGPRSTEKALPTSAAQKLMENQQNLRRAEQALALVEGKPAGGAKGDLEATGWKGFVPDVVLQRLDPKGVEARAAIADLGSLVIHDRSGAAVTASEFPRLRPFIPAVTDDAPTVRKKLSRFVQEYRAVTEEAAEFYKQSGYKVPAEVLKPGVSTPASAAPEGVDEKLWNAMTPEERALWAK